MIAYKKGHIEGALELLDNITVKGVDNAKRIVMIAEILQNPEKEIHDGSKDEKV